MPQEDKSRLRRQLLDARRARPPAEIEQARAAIAGHLLTRCRAEGWTTVAAYVPLRTEPGSPALLEGLRAAGVRVLVPVLLPDNDLDWAVWGEDGLLGTTALAGCQVVLVPALAVSTHTGVRLGRGGGSYDRALGRRTAGTPAIALLHDGELRPDVPSEPWDTAVEEVVTPAGFVRLPIAGPRWTGNGLVGDHG
jgi:5-formyltetrahydrofolate cyclo-ligase